MAEEQQQQQQQQEAMALDNSDTTTNSRSSNSAAAHHPSHSYSPGLHCHAVYISSQDANQEDDGDNDNRDENPTTTTTTTSNNNKDVDLETGRRHHHNNNNKTSSSSSSSSIPLRIVPKSTKGKLCCFGLLALAIFSIVLIGMVCGSGHCQTSNNTETTTTSEDQLWTITTTSISPTLVPTTTTTTEPPTLAPTATFTELQVEEEPTTNTNYCGSSWADAVRTCGDPCPQGTDEECPEGLTCFGDVASCSIKLDATTNNVCASTWEEAQGMCTSTCPGGINSECPLRGQVCFACAETTGTKGTNTCGFSWDEPTQKSCRGFCPNGLDSECPQGQQCFACNTKAEDSDPPADQTTSNYCGTNWTDAANTCGTSCPGGLDDECPEGRSCFGDIASCSGGNTVTDPITTNYCGSSWTDAAHACSTACPGGMDNECPHGQTCFGDIASCTSV